MTPNLGQGACQALEDAVVVARCLAGAVDVEAALQQYETQRLPRANRVVLMSRRFGVMLQLENPLMNRLRDLLFALPGMGSLQTRQLKWLTEFNV